MNRVTIRELRNHGGQVIDRVEAGESLVVTRDGRPVAELRPLTEPAISPQELVRRAKLLPRMDYARLRDELDAIIDPGL